MAERLIGEMEATNFEALLGDFNARQAEQEGDLLPAEVFFQLWAEMERADSTIDIEGRIIGDQIVFRLPPAQDRLVEVEGNVIQFGRQRVRVHLAQT